MSIEDRPRRARPWLAFAGATLVLLAVGGSYLCWPRQADLLAFDPDAMARLETSLWRDYYEKRYVALFRGLYAVARDEYNFSPLDSVRIAYAAASAARAFQPSTSRAEAEVALPSLVTYFGILSAGAKAKFDIEEAARTELAWWQARREAVAPDDYGLIIARVATLVYGIDSEGVRQSGRTRAQAMAYRDRRGADITESDWSVIREHLTMAYGLLKRALRAP